MFTRVRSFCHCEKYPAVPIGLKAVLPDNLKRKKTNGVIFARLSHTNGSFRPGPHFHAYDVCLIARAAPKTRAELTPLDPFLADHLRKGSCLTKLYLHHLGDSFISLTFRLIQTE
ncbi:hypothetical protein JTE90_025204 [Oedothorax gibbosus]|uniref:Uncharacterized protein n=1 Tax=Oedothorax gibbosus TaxID=931172 RepID=A0AAV6UW15_9ARAC|nr:hypothetical protein JTE90_025204 [Oedothorax gibbosus]